MKKNTFAKVTPLLIASMLLLQACPNGKHTHIGCGGPMQGSEPTTMMLVFQNISNASDADTAIWTNANPNGNNQVIDDSRARLTLMANSSYRVHVFILNITSPIGSAGYNVTTSVETESKSYLVCFEDTINFYGNLAANLGWVRTDFDNGTPQLPLGLVDSFWTGSDSTCGILQATLRHQYQVKTGDCSPGYVDIEAQDTVYVSPGKGK